MNKYILGGLVVVVLVGFFLIGNTDNKEPINTAVAAPINILESNFDFGDIEIFNGKVTTPYTLKNIGDEDVIITSAVTSCMCTEGEIDGVRFGMHDNSSMNIVIPAGGEKTLTAIFDPLAHGPKGTGKITRELFLKTNSTSTPELSVKFSANVIKTEN